MWWTETRICSQPDSALLMSQNPPTAGGGLLGQCGVGVRMCEDHLVGMMMRGCSHHRSALAPCRPELCLWLCMTSRVWCWPIFQSHTAACTIYITLPCVIPVCQHVNTGGEVPTDKVKRSKEVSGRVLLRGVTTNTPVTCRHTSWGWFTSHPSWLSPWQPGSPVPCVRNKGWRCPPAGSLPQLSAHLPRQPSPVVCLALPSLPIASPPWPWNPTHKCHPVSQQWEIRFSFPRHRSLHFHFWRKRQGGNEVFPSAAVTLFSVVAQQIASLFSLIIQYHLNACSYTRLILVTDITGTAA